MKILHIDGSCLLFLDTPLVGKFLQSFYLPLWSGKRIKPLSFPNRKHCHAIEFFRRTYKAELASRRRPEEAIGGLSVLPARQDFLPVFIPCVRRNNDDFVWTARGAVDF